MSHSFDSAKREVNVVPPSVVTGAVAGEHQATNPDLQEVALDDGPPGLHKS